MVRKRPNWSLPVLEGGGGANGAPRTPEWFRSLPIFCTGCRVRFSFPNLRVFVVHFWPCSHHGGHFDADVLCHHGPRLPLLHHLHAVIIPPSRGGGRCPTRTRCSFFPPASLVFIMDSGRGAFLSTHVLTLENWDLNRSSVCICTALVRKYWCAATIISKCFRPVVACWRSRGLAVMDSHWSFHSTRKERSRRAKWGVGGKPKPSPAHLHYHHSPSHWPFKC